MPALWESSERPMYIKTVWVGGFRHAILTHDDPYLLQLNAKKKRPHSSASYAGKTTCDPKFSGNKFRKTRLSQNEDQLGDCLRNLNFEIKPNRTPIRNKIKFKNDNKEQDYIEQLNLTELEVESEDELVLKANAQRLNDFDTSRSKFNNIATEMRTVRSNRTARTETINENNDLSDRVLQWLDLAGKIDILGPNKEATRITQPRHSWHEMQKRNNGPLSKSKTGIDLKDNKVNDSSKDSPKDKVQIESGAIDRHNLYITTPANTIEAYARQSRNNKDTPRNTTTKKPNDPPPKPPKITSVHQTRQKVANEIHAMEKQYADLINKKIIPNYNKQVFKRQVHIFVPTVPKKSVTSTSTSRTESMISQRIT